MTNENDYILTLTGHNIYREIELTTDLEAIRIGSTTRCDVRFRRELVFDSFEFLLQREGEVWTISCSPEIYISSKGILRLMKKNLLHGDTFLLRYASSGAELFTISYAIDFDRDLCNFDKWIPLSGINLLTIGSKINCNLCLRSRYIVDDFFVFEKKDSEWWLIEHQSQYGATINGIHMNRSALLKNKSFISIANFHFYFNDDKLIFSRTDDIIISNLPVEVSLLRVPTSKYPRFNRNTRIQRPYDTRPIPILDPPAPIQDQHSSVLLRLLPLVGMIALMVVMRTMMSGSGTGNYLIFSVAMMGMGAVTSIIGMIADRRRRRKERKHRIENYRKYIEGKEKDIQEKRNTELMTRELRYPDIDELLERVNLFSANLFDRRPQDSDFLDVRLGSGQVVSVQLIEYKDAERLEIDELAQLPAQLAQKYRIIENAPVIIPLANAGAIGIVGSIEKRDAFLRSMVIDIVCRQYAGDVRIFFVVEQKHKDVVLWARNLPHAQNVELNMHNIACDEESKASIVEYLYKELSNRIDSDKTYKEGSDSAQRDSHMVVFVVDDYGFYAHPVSRYVDFAATLGVTFIFFQDLKERLPLGCTHIINLGMDTDIATMIDVADDRNPQDFSYKNVLLNTAFRMAQTLAPVYGQEVSLEATLVSNITLYELLGIIGADDLDLDTRWQNSQVYKSMAAPIGVTTTSVVNLDLSDRAQGPHGLVAGTTGSGKSELLLTYVLSMAILYHPYDVGFMIIDFKGGGMANQLAHLPHLIGTITNIDGREIDRSLKSIRAELQKRQLLFAKAGVNHIDSYIRKYKTGSVNTPLPHLVIIVDEFAELKADHPEFMTELISTARIGRSLGVHLILATQKPAGQVSDQIWSNSRFKLCLKVQTRQDSNEVLKSPLAAEIKEPGRAYLQVGNNEIFELFQSAYSGASEHADTEATHEFAIYELEDSGKRKKIYESRKSKKSDQGRTQLEAIVEYVRQYCINNHVEQLPSICLPPLADVINYPSDVKRKDQRFALGVYDDPDNQYQGEAYFDLERANTFIIGAAQTGKTNLLQAIIRSIALAYTSAQAWIYIMDFGSNILLNFEELAHVGGVAISGEDEKVRNLYRLLTHEVAKRKNRLLEAGVGSFDAYLEAGYTDLAHIFILLDNFAAFNELYGNSFGPTLQSLCREGLAYGLSFVITNTSTTGFGYRYMSNFSNFIDFICNDISEYANTLGRVHLEPKNVQGRALTVLNKTVYEMQTYLAFKGAREVERVSAIKIFVEQRNAINSRNHVKRAQNIPVVPDNLNLQYIDEHFDIKPSELICAMSYVSIGPVRFDLDNQFSIAIVGQQSDVRTSVMKVILAELRLHAKSRPIELTIIDEVHHKLSSFKNDPWVVAYYDEPAAIKPVFDAYEKKLIARRDKLQVQGMSIWNKEPYLVLIVNSADCLATVSGDNNTLERYKHIAQSYSNLHCLIVFSVPDVPVPFVGAPFLRVLKSEARGFVLTQNIAEEKFYDVAPMALRANRTPLERGQAFLFRGNDVEKIRIASG